MFTDGSLHPGQRSGRRYLISSTQNVTHRSVLGETSVLFSCCYVYMKGQIQECCMRPRSFRACRAARTGWERNPAALNVSRNDEKLETQTVKQSACAMTRLIPSSTVLWEKLYEKFTSKLCFKKRNFFFFKEKEKKEGKKKKRHYIFGLTF